MRISLAFLVGLLLFCGQIADVKAETPAAAKNFCGRSAALVWQHGTTREAAKNAIVNELQSLGYADEVRWRNYKGSVSVAMGVILSVRGYISDDAIVIEKCSGAVSSQVLNETRIILERLFPGGNY